MAQQSARKRARGRGRRGVAADAERAADCFERALATRQDLLSSSSTNVCRVFNGAADGVPGLVIERMGEVLIAQLHQGRLRLAEPDVRDLCARVRERLGARAVYRKLFARDRSAALPSLDRLHTDPLPWLGEPVESEFPVVENGIRFLIRPYQGYSVGLFLEHRDNRTRVRDLASGRRVLNAFAYTCAFSVSATMGGAAHTASVDIAKKYLEWGRRNFAANRLDPTRHSFVCCDVFEYYRRAKRKGQRFDLIILDPPTFARAKRPTRVFVLADDLQRLVTGAVELLNPGGYLLLATNHRQTSRRRLESAVARAAATRPFQVVARPVLSVDFRGDPAYAKSVLLRLD